MLKSKDIQNKHLNLKLNRLLNVLKILKAQSLKLKKVLISFNIIAMMLPILILIMIMTIKNHAIILEKLNGLDTLINVIQVQLIKLETELLIHSIIKLLKFQLSTYFLMLGSKIMVHALKKIQLAELKITRVINHLDLTQIFHALMDFQISKQRVE